MKIEGTAGSGGAGTCGRCAFLGCYFYGAAGAGSYCGCSNSNGSCYVFNGLNEDMQQDWNVTYCASNCDVNSCY